jgi:hypothetical protein
MSLIMTFFTLHSSVLDFRILFLGYPVLNITDCFAKTRFFLQIFLNFLVLLWLFLAVRIETRSWVVSADGRNYGLDVRTVTGLFLASAENYVQTGCQTHPAFCSASTRGSGMHPTAHCHLLPEVRCCKKGNARSGL